MLQRRGAAASLPWTRSSSSLPSCKLHNLYGPTEAAVDVTAWNCVPNEPRRIGADRPPDREHQDVRARRSSSSRCRSAWPASCTSAASGGAAAICNRPELTAERFVPDPFTHGRAHVPHRRPGPLARRRRARVPRPHRLPGQDPRLPHRAGEIEAQLVRYRGGARRRWSWRATIGRGDMRLVAYIVPRGRSPERVRAATAFLTCNRCPTTWCRSVFVAMGEHPAAAQRQGRSQGAAGARRPEARRQRPEHGAA